MGTETQWRGQADTSRRRLWSLVGVSVLLHVPFTPIAALLGLVTMLAAPVDSEPAGPTETLDAIPIDLLEGLEPAAVPEEPPEAPPTTPDEAAEEEDPFAALDLDDEPPEPEPLSQSRDSEDDRDVDGGADGAAGAATDAGAPMAAADAGTEGALAAADAGAGAGIRDPVAASGNAGQVVDSNANVRLLLHSDRLRGHAFAAQVGRLLAATYQWRDFFGPAGLDPIADIDRYLIVGPQFRDSSEVAVVLEHNVGRKRMHEAVDAIVRASGAKGTWSNPGMPVATAHADRADRVLILPNERVVVMVPPTARDAVVGQLRQAGTSFRLKASPGSEVLTAYLVTPWRPFRGLPFQVPKSIQWARLRLVLEADGSAVAHIEAQDESEDAAKENARKLQTQLDALTQIELGVLGALIGASKTRIIEPARFTAKGAMIHGTLEATPAQVKRGIGWAMGYADQMLREAERRRNARDDAKGPSAVPSDPTSPGEGQRPAGKPSAPPGVPPPDPGTPPAEGAPAPPAAPSPVPVPPPDPSPPSDVPSRAPPSSPPASG